MNPDPTRLASLPPHALRNIEERTGVSLEGLDDIMSAAKLDTLDGRNVIELELRIDLSEPAQRDLAVAQLRRLADRLGEELKTR